VATRAEGRFDIKGKRIAVLGAGRTGTAVSRFLARRGAHVLLSEKQNKSSISERVPRTVDVEFGGHSARVLESELIVKSPGIPYKAPVLKKARRKKIPVWDELELVSRFLDPEKVIGITGTNGKTTTTSLVSAMCRQAGLRTLTAGNIGLPVSTVLDDVSRADVVVLELSSYQLERQRSFRPHLAAVLNLTPDHLSRHRTMTAYRKAKERIFINQAARDMCVLNYEDAYCRAMAPACPGKVIFFSSSRKLRSGVWHDARGWHGAYNGRRFSLHPAWRLPGRHNVENGLAAVALAALFGIAGGHIQKALSRFKGVPHRLEQAGSIKGVRYINDSKATNVGSTAVALNSYAGPLWLILGGEDKGSSYKPLKAMLQNRVVGVLLIGRASNRIYADLNGTVPVVRCGTLKKAVQYCVKYARLGDMVLLSPACASFDQYMNFEERGRHFKKLIKQFKRQKRIERQL